MAQLTRAFTACWASWRVRMESLLAKRPLGADTVVQVPAPRDRCGSGRRGEDEDGRGAGGAAVDVRRQSGLHGGYAVRKHGGTNNHMWVLLSRNRLLQHTRMSIKTASVKNGITHPKICQWINKVFNISSNPTTKIRLTYLFF